MVVVWSNLAGDDREYTGVIVGLNSLFQVACFVLLAWVYLELVPQGLGLALAAFDGISVRSIACNGGLYLGVPFVAGILTRLVVVRYRGLAYFEGVFFLSWGLCRVLRLGYAPTCSVALSASGNNFELAIALCIASFGVHSNQAFAAIIGPLVEVPIMLSLVWWVKKWGRF